MSRLLIAFFALAFGFVLTACQSPEDEDSPAAAAAKAPLPPLVAPTTSADKEWVPYLQQVVSRNMDGVTDRVEGQRVVATMPWGSHAELATTPALVTWLVPEGADILMVKPALPYLDVIRAVRDEVDVPVVAYQVSGEFAMLHAAAERGWLDLDRAMLETVVSLRRAGADIVITYFAKPLARALARQVAS